MLSVGKLVVPRQEATSFDKLKEGEWFVVLSRGQYVYQKVGDGTCRILGSENLDATQWSESPELGVFRIQFQPVALANVSEFFDWARLTFLKDLGE